MVINREANYPTSGLEFLLKPCSSQHGKVLKIDSLRTSRLSRIQLSRLYYLFRNGSRHRYRCTHRCTVSRWTHNRRARLRPGKYLPAGDKIFPKKCPLQPPFPKSFYLRAAEEQKSRFVIIAQFPAGTAQPTFSTQSILPT